jgi:alpha-galactosidase
MAGMARPTERKESMNNYKYFIKRVIVSAIASTIVVMFLSGCVSVEVLKTPSTKTETVWLSSLDLGKMGSGWGKNVKITEVVQRQTLSIGGQEFTEGINGRANSVMYIDLGKKAKRFSAYVGIDDKIKWATGSVKFRVYGDNRELFNSGFMKAKETAKKIDIDITNIKTLILTVNSTGAKNRRAYADWAEAKFEVVGAKPKAIDRPKEKAVILTPKPGPKPKINGPKLFGVRPGRSFVYRIPATGKRPMSFAAMNLPKGLKLEPRTGVIVGNAPKRRGDYIITLKATNAHGTNEKPFKIVVGETLALTPPMGWNSWYIHYHRVTDKIMREAADAMVESGMAEFGYMYVNIDDCWMKKRGDEPYRDEDGAMLSNAKFPNMKAMTDYIHSKGLRAGLYTSPGPWTCARYVGSYQHEEIDARKFAEWGFDFLKYDWCSYRDIAKNKSLEEFMKPYRQMGDILKALDRDIVLNLCQYGMGDVWKWGGEVGGHCWRTTGDLGLSPGFYYIGLYNAQHYEYARPGQWNDPDYILIGWVAHKNREGRPTTLSPSEQYAYMSMWSLMASPLFFSGDMTKLDDFTLNVLCNAEVIEVNQDPLGKQARIALQSDDHLILAKDMEDGSLAVGLFNASEIETKMTVKWSELNISGKHRVRDLWRQKDIGTFDNEYTIKVPRHGVVMLRFHPVG